MTLGRGGAASVVHSSLSCDCKEIFLDWCLSFESGCESSVGRTSGGGVVLGGGIPGGIMTLPREGLTFGTVPGSRSVGVSIRFDWAFVVSKAVNEIKMAGYRERRRVGGIRS